MEELKVLITTSGIGSRLGDLTQYTNKSLVRIGKKPAIYYIVNNYIKNNIKKFVITLGHFGEHVREYLTIQFPKIDFEFVDVDLYEGEGSSLLYSMYQANQLLQQPFIFHACDTYVEEVKTSFDCNWLAYNSDISSASQYRTVRIISDLVAKINDKGEQNHDGAFIGVVGIKDYEVFWKTAEKFLKQKNSDLSDYTVIKDMISNNYNFFGFETNKWLDIGNIDSLTEAREKISDSFFILDKVDESIFIDEENERVIKFFANKEVCDNRVKRYNHLNGMIPKIMDKTDHFYSYEFAKGKEYSHCIDLINIENFFNWCNTNLWSNTDSHFIDERKDNIQLKKFYRDKTIERIEKYKELKGIKTDTFMSVNGLNIPNIENIFEHMDENNLWPIKDTKFTNFHGDLVLDNIIYNVENNQFKLIDWRQDFVGDIQYGDPNYDIAKLKHSLTLPNFILEQQLFDESENNLFVWKSNTFIDIENRLDKIIVENGYDLDKINLIKSIIWLNMSPLHPDPMSDFLFRFGKYNLWRNLNGFS